MADEGDNQRQAEAAAGPAIAPVQVKLPPYWPADPQVWFAQVEAYFEAHRITTQKAKWRAVAQALDPKYAVEVRDFIITPPEDDPFDKLKEALIGRTQKSEQARLRELLSREELGDESPSHLRRRMQQLLGERTMDAAFLRELFVQRLPPAVRMILASAPTGATLTELALLADKIHESTASQPVMEVQALADKRDDELSTLKAELSKLTQAVHALTLGTPSRGRSLDRGQGKRRNGSQSRSPGRNNRTTSADDYCWYHRKFGEKAKQCRPPCAFSASPSGNDRASH